jgi:glycosyltransferase involved in cell wall biosynthesis
MLGNSQLRKCLFALDKRLFRQEGAPLRHLLHPKLETALRYIIRQAFLFSEARHYRLWTAQRLKERARIYQPRPEKGLLSFVTTVWNTPVRYMEVLVKSLLVQWDRDSCEWIILDNGSSSPATIAFLQGLTANEGVRLHRIPENLGIIGGMRYCLERARNRYIVPLDSDDSLSPDCIRVLIAEIQRNGHPALLYTDEDKLLHSKPTSPYFKPDWDPVLFLNSAYTAHLGVIDRNLALQLHAYTDAQATGSHDWDTFVRFLINGFTPVHIPEILYSWRMHPQSTASNISSKAYIHTSQKAVLRRYLASLPQPAKYSLDYSPLFSSTPDWWIRRRHDDARPLYCAVLSRNPCALDIGLLIEIADSPEYRARTVSLDATLAQLTQFVDEAASQNGLVLFLSDQVKIKNDEWFWEALALTEIHKDAVMIGGRIYDHKEIILDAGRYFGFGDGCGCPDRGRSVHDPGYFSQMWKQHSVSAVSTQFSVIDACFLQDMLVNGGAAGVKIRYLGPRAGVYALRKNKRVIYSPFFSGLSDEDWNQALPPADMAAFLQANRDILPDHRFFSRNFSLESWRPYRLAI